MPNVSCKICGKDFYVKPNHIKLGWGKYCSIDCRTKSQLKGQTVSCNYCGNSTYKSPHSLLHSKSKKYFCDKKCQTNWRNKQYLEENSKNWKNGIRAYRNILKRDVRVPKCVFCGIEREILLVVHHLDKNRKNNKISNLIWLCHNCHFLVHHDIDTSKKLILTLKVNKTC